MFVCFMCWYICLPISCFAISLLKDADEEDIDGDEEVNCLDISLKCFYFVV